MGQALLIIDVQKDYTGEKRPFAFPRDEAKRLIENINVEIKKAQEKKIPIIFIRQVHKTFFEKLISLITGAGLARAGTPGVEIDSGLIRGQDHVFDKVMPSAFSNSDFKTFLNTQKINELLITGLDGCACVQATTKEALKLHFKTTLILPAIVSSFPNRWKKTQKKLQDLGATLLQG